MTLYQAIYNLLDDMYKGQSSPWRQEVTFLGRIIYTLLAMLVAVCVMAFILLGFQWTSLAEVADNTLVQGFVWGFVTAFLINIESYWPDY